MCPNQKGKSLKQLTSTPEQFQLEDSGLKIKLQKSLKFNNKAWDSFIKPRHQMATPINSPAARVKTKSA